MKKYHIITFGCQANLADSEKIARRLESLGYSIAKQVNEANLIVINACSVRQSAINRVYGKIRNLKNKKIILAGCILKEDKKKLLAKNKNIEFWHPDEYFDLTPIISNPNTAYIPIMTGCNNFCTYCAVPYTRGRERSRPAKDVIQDAKNAIKKSKEIWLLGQNVNSYKDKKINFPELLKIINSIPGDFKIHFLSSHPKDFSDDLIKAIGECEKVSREIHLPVQSGDDEILKKMNRNYTASHYKNLVKKIRKAIRGVKISTDAIVGFPGETEKQFQNTVKLFKELKFSKAYISKYSPRPGTLAAKMKDNVPIEEKKRRWKILNEMVNKNE